VVDSSTTINDDYLVTVFLSIASNMPVGCRIKGARRDIELDVGRFAAD
jgi:hypothetical protein